MTPLEAFLQLGFPFLGWVLFWIPAFAGMTPSVVRQDEPKATGVLRTL